jgi:hypothetical protein
VTCCVISFDVNACKFIAGHVELHTMEFLEDFEKIVEVFNTYISKVINNEAKLDGTPFVLLKAWSQG